MWRVLQRALKEIARNYYKKQQNICIEETQQMESNTASMNSQEAKKSVANISDQSNSLKLNCNRVKQEQTHKNKNKQTSIISSYVNHNLTSSSTNQKKQSLSMIRSRVQNETKVFDHLVRFVYFLILYIFYFICQRSPNGVILSATSFQLSSQIIGIAFGIYIWAISYFYLFFITTIFNDLIELP